jgi:T4-like virus tail tube protein gp19
MGGLQKMGAGALSAAKGAFAKNNTLSFDPNEKWHEKAFIEVSGIEMGVDTDPKPEGGYNYPLDIPTRMRNPHVTLKRLFRPKNESDVWSNWIKETFDAMAYWKTPIKTLYHPNLGADSGKPLVLYSVALYDAYPVKQSFGTFNSTSEDLMTEEIELSYSNMQSAYGTVKEAKPK